MKKEKTMATWRFGLMLVLLCLWSLPQLAGAAPLAQIPTSPLTGYFAPGQTTPTPDYYTTANWANSPPLAKFVDTLPGLTAANSNNLGQYLPVAVADTTTFPGSDYYIIKLVEYSKKMHSDLNPTKLRGYVQLNAAGAQVDPPNYLGPVIVATKDRPIRIKFINGLPTGSGGDLFIPVDETVMGAGETPTPGVKYSQNRADLHLHGGRTPWISDGTPHQWITPAGEPNPYKAGVSLQNVPDMCFAKVAPFNAIPRATDPNCLTGSSDPGPGATTYYFTNQQSTRLMFYHDHAWGITRLNVYAGEAAGYVITDSVEQDLVTRGVLPADMIPLVIQDKTFVNADVTTHPSGGGKVMTTRETDPLWNWGSLPKVNGVVPPVTGDLWLPHVYMPAQNSLAGSGGVNPFGRWMYGPWFFPATSVVHGPVANPYYDPNCSSPDPFVFAQCQTPGQPVQIPGTPNVSMGMEAFQDSVVVNGTVFPSITVDPKAYRLRILNAASDRFQNLSFYVADATAGNVSPDPRLLAPGKSNLTEVKMVSASAELAAANNWPADWPVDGRDGGVPDPGLCLPGGLACPNLGPSFLQIGTEGGFLPAPTVRAPQPVTYITDPTAFWVGIVDKTGLALGPAERADVIVDFSAYAGKTLILFNDAPAAWPARVPGYDYYTGAPDLRDSGGYGTGGTFNPATGAWEGGTGPLPGYAPNTRTVMQVIVSGGAATPFNSVPLENEFTSAAPVTTANPTGMTLFERSQEPIIVGQAAYSSAYPNSYFPTNFPWEGINQINDHYLQFVTLAGEEVKATTEPKGIHDEMGASFDPEYGRMSGNLAMQLPNPSTLNALLVLYGYSDVPTENVNNSPTVNVQVLPGIPGQPGTLADGTQIWKISHNGVDTHPIHFHIFDVQLINRVGWDGQIALPEANELGWKDTVKISPLMDTIVAVRPRAPALPFGIPNSLRPLNPGIPIDSAMGFTNPTPGSDWFLGNSFLSGTPIYGFSSIDWTTGEVYPAENPAAPTNYPYPNYKGIVTNVLYDFGWEYVWHCHILSHEEMDMMRPIVLKVPTELPPAFTATVTGTGASRVLTWTDPTPVVYTDLATYGNPANEVGFNVYRAATTAGAAFIQLNARMLPANTVTYTDTTAVSGTSYYYKVEAVNASGSTSVVIGLMSATLATTGGLVAPTNLTITATVTGKPAGVTFTSVEFFDGTTLIGTDTTPDTTPYRFVWNNVPIGTHSITVKITDNNGFVTTSAPIVRTVTGTITADFTATGSISGTTDIGFCETVNLASTSTGTISSYNWLANGLTYTTILVPNVDLPLGINPVTLTVTSNAGVTASITKDVAVVNHLPVAVTGGTYTVPLGGSITLNGSGTDADPCDTLTYAWNIDNRGAYDYFTANPSISYSTLASVLGAGTHTMTFQVTDSKGGVGTATTTITVPPLPANVTITSVATANGTITPAGTALVPGGTNKTYTITPNAGFMVSNLVVDGVLLPGANSYTFTFAVTDHYIIAYFAPIFNITAAAAANGAISPTGSAQVAGGTNQTYTITPNVGYLISNLVVDGTTLPGATSYTFSNVAADHYILAYFSPIPVAITSAAAANGTISPLGSTPIVFGSNQTYTITPNPGSIVTTLIVDGTAVPAATSYTFTNVVADHYILAYFGPAPVPVTITAAAGPNGAITPAGATLLTNGSNMTYTITPNPGFVVTNLVVDGTLLPGATSYTFTNVTADHYINAYFGP